MTPVGWLYGVTLYLLLLYGIESMKEILKQAFRALAILAFVVLAMGIKFFLFATSQLADAWSK